MFVLNSNMNFLLYYMNMTAHCDNSVSSNVHIATLTNKDISDMCFILTASCSVGKQVFVTNCPCNETYSEINFHATVNMFLWVKVIFFSYFIIALLLKMVLNFILKHLNITMMYQISLIQRNKKSSSPIFHDLALWNMYYFAL